MKRIRWGILGTATHARKALVPAMKAASNAEVMAVASRSLDTARQFAETLGIPKAYGSYEELLADPDIDAIYNPLPTTLHAPWSIRCAEAGKPTLCEKPLSLNAAEAVAMADAFRKAKVLLVEGIMYRHHPLTRRVREIVHAGGIGRLVAIRSSFMAEIAANGFRWKAETGGGALYDLGCYCIHIMRHLTAEEPSSVKACALWHEPGVDTSLAGILMFPSGVLGYFGCSMRSFFDCSYDVLGTHGRILIDHGGMALWPGAEFTIKYWHHDKSEEIRIPAVNEYQLMVEDFCDALLHNRKPAFPIEDSIANMRVIDELLKSARDGGEEGEEEKVED